MHEKTMASTLVIKIGTSSLTSEDGSLNRQAIERLVGESCELLNEGRRLVIVSSGAVRAGVERLRWGSRTGSIALRQAAAAVGQVRLMECYDAAFSAQGRTVAQILLTRQLAQERVRYVNARNTLQTLLKHGIVPVINENDTVATEELQFGDNDTLAALVAALVQAETLLLLTNVDGLLDGEGRLVGEVHRIGAAELAMAGGAGTFGSGGMLTKLQAAEIAGAAGVATLIARASRPGVLMAAARGERPGTWFAPSALRLRGRKHWLAYGIQPAGSLVIHPQAQRAVQFERRSLLPAGVVRAEGRFSAGESVRLVSIEGEEFARGLVTCGHRDIARLAGRQSSEVAELLGEGARVEIVHRDDLVLLGSSGSEGG